MYVPKKHAHTIARTLREVAKPISVADTRPAPRALAWSRVGCVPGLDVLACRGGKHVLGDTVVGCSCVALGWRNESVVGACKQGVGL